MKRMLIALALLVGLAAGLVQAQPVAPPARALYDRALQLEAAGNQAAALPLLWQASGLSPDDPRIQDRLGEALERIGVLDAAIDAYRRAADLDPSSSAVANHLVLALVKAGRSEEAVARARAWSGAAPSDPDRLFTLGLAQTEQDVEASLAIFRRVLAIAPEHALARYNLALTLSRLDRSADALAELDRLTGAARRAEALYLKGVIHARRGEAVAAVRALREAVDARPQDVETCEALGAALLQGDDANGAVRVLGRCVTIAPERAAPRFVLARALRRAGREAEADRALDAARERQRQASAARESVTWTWAGMTAAAAGESERAVSLLTRAVSVDPSNAGAHYQLGQALSRMGRARDAQAAFDRARALNPALVPPAP
jgi:tetratricopeptide (TPR) repeat protein